MVGLAERPKSGGNRAKEALRAARERAGLVGHEIDTLLKQTPGTHAHYESDRTPTARYLRKVAPALGIPDWRVLNVDGIENVKRITRATEPQINLVPYWGVVPCGSWEPPSGEGDVIEIPDEIDPTGVIAVRVSGDSMSPRLCHGQLVAVRLDPTPRDGVITLAQSSDKELTLKVLARRDGEWVLLSINKEYGEAKAASWSIVGHAVAISEHDPAGLRP